MPEEADTDELIITIDKDRSVTVRPVDNDRIVLTLEDPHTVAVCEMSRPDVVGLYEALEDWLKR